MGGSYSSQGSDPFTQQLAQDWRGYNTGRDTAEQKAYRDWLRMKQEEYLSAGSPVDFREWYAQPIRQRRTSQRAKLRELGQQARRAYGGGIYVGSGNNWQYFDSLDDWWNSINTQTTTNTTPPNTNVPGKPPGNTPPPPPANQPPPNQPPPTQEGPGYDPVPNPVPSYSRYYTAQPATGTAPAPTYQQGVQAQPKQPKPDEDPYRVPFSGVRNPYASGGY